MNSMRPEKYRPTATPDLPNRQWPDRRLTQAPIWVSVDLRDGNQALANPMTVEQKLKLWDQLVAIGFKTIEIGFPSASQLEFDFTRRLIEENRIPEDVTVQVLVQAREHLIKRTYEALQGVKQAVVHVYNTTSTVQRENVFCKSKADIKTMAIQGAQWVKPMPSNTRKPSGPLNTPRKAFPKPRPITPWRSAKRSWTFGNRQCIIVAS